MENNTSYDGNTLANFNIKMEEEERTKDMSSAAVYIILYQKFFHDKVLMQMMHGSTLRYFVVPSTPL